MLKNIFLVLISVIVLAFSSCSNENFDTVMSSGELSFSKDTIYLDTIFTNTSSSTRTLKVYNKSSSNITIPTIKLGRGDNSYYRLNVDGIPGKSFDNIDILARDSIFIFIEATIDYSEVTNPIYTDSIVFDSDSNLQDVKLVTLVQDAYFLYPKRNDQGVKETIVLGENADGEEITVEGFYLDGNTIWKSEKPYVIYGYVGVPENSKLTIEKGSKIHFHKNSGLLVDHNASLLVRGELGEEVIFEGDRLEPIYGDIAGQWGLIWLRAGSKENDINHAIIKNSTVGVLVDSVGSLTNPTLNISNTQIYNTSTFGILGRNTNIEGENIVIGNNGMSSIAILFGGVYNFKHITIANYWNSSVREYPALLINNSMRDLEEANFGNCIIDGSSNIEIILENNENQLFNYSFKNNLIKFDDINNGYSGNPLYDFNDENHYEGNIFNGLPDFKNIQLNEYVIGVDSDAIDLGDKGTAAQVPLDILEINRTDSPDSGAYQHILFQE